MFSLSSVEKRLIGAVAQAELSDLQACPAIRADAMQLWMEECASILMMSGGVQGVRDEIRVYRQSAGSGCDWQLHPALTSSAKHLEKLLQAATVSALLWNAPIRSGYKRIFRCQDFLYRPVARV